MEHPFQIPIGMKTMEKNILEARDFSVFSNKRKIIDSVSTCFKDKELTLIYGPRGSGKSVFLRSFVFLNEEFFDDISYEGELFFKGQKITFDDSKFLRNQIAYSDTSFIEPIESFTIREMISFATGRVSWNTGIGGRASSLLKKFELLPKLKNGLDSPISILNSKERVLFLFFLAFIREPDVIIFDSIMDHLDNQTIDELCEFLEKVKGNYTTIISTRNFNSLIGIADRILYFKDGRIIFEGDPQKFIMEWRS